MIQCSGRATLRCRGSARAAGPQPASSCLHSLGVGAHLTSLLEFFIPDPSQTTECWLWSSGTQLWHRAVLGFADSDSCGPSAIGLARGRGQAVGWGVRVPPLGPRWPVVLVQGLLRALSGQVSAGCDIHRVYLVWAASRWLSAPHRGGSFLGTWCPAREIGGQAGRELDVGRGHDGGPPGGLHSNRHEGRRPSSRRGGRLGEGARGGCAGAGESRREGPF